MVKIRFTNNMTDTRKLLEWYKSRLTVASGNDDQRQTAANALVEILNQIKGVDNIDRDDEASK
jgi:hypothetical protein